MSFRILIFFIHVLALIIVAVTAKLFSFIISDWWISTATMISDIDSKEPILIRTLIIYFLENVAYNHALCMKVVPKDNHSTFEEHKPDLEIKYLFDS